MRIVPAYVRLDDVGHLVAERKPPNPSFVAEQPLDAHDFAIGLDRLVAAEPLAGRFFAEHPTGTVRELVLDVLPLARGKRAGLKGHVTLPYDLEPSVAEPT